MQGDGEVGVGHQSSRIVAIAFPDQLARLVETTSSCEEHGE
jgi:hypothetical protein